MDPWRRWETQAIRESRRRPGVSQHRAPTRGPDPGAPAVEHRAPEPGHPDPGTMLVPVDAWNRVLEQLGNLHQAGQELAEAKERAARAETESRFLRERLAELRAPSPADTAATDAPAGAVADPHAPSEPRAAPARARRLQIIRSAYRDLRQTRR